VNVTTEIATRIARDIYGISGNPTPLPGEWDANFRLRTPEGEELVLKIMRPDCDPALVDLQCRVLDRLEQHAPSLTMPRVRRTKSAERWTTIELDDGSPRLVWMLDWIPGRVLAETRPRTAALLESLGRMLGSLDVALEGFRHPHAGRPLRWNLARSEWIRDEIGVIGDPSRRALVARVVDLYERSVMPHLDTLRWGVIHGDANDYNVIVDGIGHDARAKTVIDFGDAMLAPIVCEPAIAAAYAIFDTGEPLHAAARLVAGYHAANPLRELEIELLFPLLMTRLAASVVSSAGRSARGHSDPYVTVSESSAWSALERLSAIHPRFAHYTFRAACGLESVPHQRDVVEFLRTRRTSMVPVLEAIAQGNLTRIDLSAGSTLTGANPENAATPALSPLIVALMKREGAVVGVGRYAEARGVYTAAAFGGEDPLAERRTVHIGIDLFADAGTEVRAPLDSVVFRVADRGEDQDWGPIVVLRHETDGGCAFYSLYAHLERASLNVVAEGDRLKAGTVVGRIGPPPENGNWPPHTHVQLITDLLDLGENFPGVARASELDVWRGLCPDPNLLLGLPDDLVRPDVTHDETMAGRKKRLGTNLALSYDEPLMIVRGWTQYLYDENAHAYLDLFNNVAHAGHGHPRVTEAVARQMALLNTNTRYLHDNINRYAERLAAHMPDGLHVCFFVSSGSEANELALRLARAHTGRETVIVLESAYHGNTTTLVDISPYKFDGPGGTGRKPWVHTVPVPDDYRGTHRRGDPECAMQWIADFEENVRSSVASGRPPGAFIVESLQSVGGQIVYPKGWLTAAFETVRAAGGLAIADEVQTGFGRLGTHFWGFEQQNARPDIVVLGKPIGNGFPLGAVVTTRAIADSFANGMEFFATFGGNPVACAAGLAVLDVVEEEALQDRALRVGTRLRDGLEALAKRHAIVGDVRGSGLFLGVELVRDRETLEPAAREAAYVVNRMRELGVLTGIDGPHHNVIKLRGPLVVNNDDADRALERFDRVLGEDAAQPPSS
jgi:4-aminobutyrate aminotransferase-like enzyme/Ser/Thr protein kinase RdoA (MazF antagonist)